MKRFPSTMDDDLDVGFTEADRRRVRREAGYGPATYVVVYSLVLLASALWLALWYFG